MMIDVLLFAILAFFENIDFLLSIYSISQCGFPMPKLNRVRLQISWCLMLKSIEMY